MPDDPRLDELRRLIYDRSIPLEFSNSIGIAKLTAIDDLFCDEKDTVGGRALGSSSSKAYLRRQTNTINCSWR